MKRISYAAPRLVLPGALVALLLMSGTALASPTCTIRGTDRGETLIGTPGPDVICGRGGNDTLRGRGGDDVLLGGDGRDILRGGAGNDDLSGENGADLFVAESAPDGADVMRGGPGTDAVSYAERRGAVKVTLGGGADDGAPGEGDDVSGIQAVTGGSGADELVGSAADELLAGLGGNDVLDGGAGTDALLAGAGNDVVRARDGRRDALISCGSGRDTATVDDRDPRASGCETVTRQAQADLSITVTGAPDPVREGDAVEYRFTVSNAGPDTATGVIVATTLPADATAEAASGCTVVGAVMTCTLPEVPAGASAGGALTVRHGSPGTKTVTSAVHSQSQDGNAANDSATVTTTVEAKAPPAGADLSVSVSDSPDPVAVLQDVAYTVQVSNAGPLAADGVSLVIDVDESWSIITRPAGCTQKLFPTTTVTCSLGSLTAGDSVTKVLGVSWNDAGDQTVRATVRGTGAADPDAANNTETETTTVN